MTPSTYAPPADLLAGRVLLITGASRGIGRAVALNFAALGATVVAQGRDVPRLEALYDEIEAAGYPQPAAVPLDFAQADTRQLDEAASRIAEAFGRLDGIVHCAARIGRLRPVAAVEAEEWSELLRINLVVPLSLTRACLPILRQSDDAAIVYTLEEHALAPGAFWAPVAVPYSALHTAIAAQAAEWASQPNVRVNAVIPGPVSSPSRAVTHPGHPRDAWPPVERVLPCYAFAAGPASRGHSGEVFRAQP